MHTSTSIAPSPKTLWAGRSISAFAVLFMLVGTLSHLVVPAPVADAFRDLGFPYGLLGGAVAIHLRVEHAVFQLLFPVIVGTLIWAGIFVRDAQLRALIPLRRS